MADFGHFPPSDGGGGASGVQNLRLEGANAPCPPPLMPPLLDLLDQSSRPRYSTA